jgi:ankyrin repeat protein
MNLRDTKGRTPLHMAIAFNNKDTVEALLNLGASPSLADQYGQRPIDICYNDSLKGLLEVKATQLK